MSHHTDHRAATKSGIDPHELGHILPFVVYKRTFIILVVLTIVTVVAAELNISKYSAALAMAIALGIASVKAFLVATNFMHLKYENPVTWLYAGFPLVLLAILIGLLFIDNPFRVDPLPGLEAQRVIRPGVVAQELVAEAEAKAAH